ACGQFKDGKGTRHYCPADAAGRRRRSDRVGRFLLRRICRLLAPLGHSEISALRSVLWGWSQGVEATLYLRRKGWSGRRWTEVMLEVSMRWRKRSCGTAGSAASRSRRLGERLASRHRRFTFRWRRMAAFVLRGGGVRDWR